MNELKPRALSVKKVCALYNLNPRTLANLRWQKRGPKYYKVDGHKIFYRPEDVESWLFSSPIQTADSLEPASQ